MFRHLFKFLLLLFLSTGLAYSIHVLFLNDFFPQVSLKLINFAYKFNVGFTLIFTTTVIVAGKRWKDQLGFIFLLSTFLKLGLFLFLIRFSEFELSKSIFLHFFLPYALSVVIEIFYVIKILNGTNFRKDK